MSKKQKWSVLAASLVGVILLGSLAMAAPVKRLTLGTHGSGAVWYILGGGLGALVGKYNPEIEITSIPTPGSVSNIRKLVTGELDIAFGMSDTCYDAYSGRGIFEGKKADIQALYSHGAIGHMTVITARGSSIHSISDMKGKKVSVGGVGSGTEIMSKIILEEHGLSFKDVNAQRLPPKESVEGLKDGTLDAILSILTTPASLLIDLTTMKDMRFIKIEREKMISIAKKSPYFLCNLPKRTYKGLDEDLLCIGDEGITVVMKDMDGEIAYKIVRTLFDHLDEYGKVHPAAATMKIDFCQNSTVPFHPGAVRYFKEKGLGLPPDYSIGMVRTLSVSHPYYAK